MCARFCVVASPHHPPCVRVPDRSYARKYQHDPQPCQVLGVCKFWESVGHDPRLHKYSNLVKPQYRVGQHQEANFLTSFTGRHDYTECWPVSYTNGHSRLQSFYSPPPWFGPYTAIILNVNRRRKRLNVKEQQRRFLRRNRTAYAWYRTFACHRRSLDCFQFSCQRKPTNSFHHAYKALSVHAAYEHIFRRFSQTTHTPNPFS